MGNTEFKHKSLHKYTGLVGCQGEVEVKSMVDLVLVKKYILHYVKDVRGMGQGLSDQHVVVCKVRLVGAWIKGGEIVDGAKRIRSEKLREHQCREGYARSLKGKRLLSSKCGNR